MVLKHCSSNADCDISELCDIVTWACTPCTQVWCEPGFMEKQGTRQCAEKCPDYWETMIGTRDFTTLVTSPTMPVTASDANDAFVHQAVNTQAITVIFTAIAVALLVLLLTSACLIWRRWASRKRKQPTPNGSSTSLQLRIPIEAECTADTEEHSPTDDPVTQSLVLSNQRMADSEV